MLARLFAPRFNVNRPLFLSRLGRRPLRFEPLEGRAMLAAVVAGDFNGDGRDDVAIGVRYEDIGAIADAGAVNVAYGSGAGLTTTNNQFFHQNQGAIPDASEAGDLFGGALAVGDFNNDGFDDLAIGVPGETVNGKNGAGAVQVLYGSLSGLHRPPALGAQFFHLDTGAIPHVTAASDNFGFALAAGDFDGDGDDDLAIGAPGKTIQNQQAAGAVYLLFGQVGGLTTTGSQVWTEASPGVAEAPEPFDFFGFALAAGDFDGDGDDDLAVGAPLADIGSADAAGSVHILRGQVGGLTGTGSQHWHQNSPGIADAAGNLDGFGTSLAAGDYNGDGRDDLAIGAPYDSSWAGSGVAHVLYGTTGLLTATGSQLWHQNVAGIADGNEAGDQFAAELAAGDFNGDGRDDLAIGVPGESLGAGGAINGAGRVQMIYGTAGGLNAASSQSWSQNSTGILDVAEAGDSFGYYLGAGDFDGDGRDDMVAASPEEDVGSIVNAGAVNVVYGTIAGLDAADNLFLHQNTPGILDVSETGDGWPAPPPALTVASAPSGDWWITVPDAPPLAKRQARLR